MVTKKWISENRYNITLAVIGVACIVLGFSYVLPDELGRIVPVVGILFLYITMIYSVYNRNIGESFSPETLHHQLGFGNAFILRSVLVWSILLWIPLLLQIGGDGFVVFFSDSTVYGSAFVLLALHLAGIATSEGLEFLLDDEANEGINWIDIFSEKKVWIEERKTLGVRPDRRGIISRISLIVIAVFATIWINYVAETSTIYGLAFEFHVLVATFLAYLFWILLFVVFFSIIDTNMSMFSAITTALEDTKKLRVFKFLERYEKWISDGCPENESNDVLERMKTGANHYGLYVRLGFLTKRFWSLVAVVLLAVALPITFATSVVEPIAIVIGFIAIIGPYLVATSFLSVELQVHKLLSNSKRVIMDAYSLLLERETTKYLGYDRGVKERLEHIQDMFEYAEDLPEWTFNTGTFFAWGLSIAASVVIQVLSTLFTPVG